MGKGQDTTDAGRDVGPGVATAVCMVKLPDEFQLELRTADGLAPDVDDTTTVARQHQLALQPFVLDALVKDARENVVVGGVADWLVHEYLAVQCIHGNAVASTDNNISGDIVDPGTLGRKLARDMNRRSQKHSHQLVRQPGSLAQNTGDSSPIA